MNKLITLLLFLLFTLPVLQAQDKIILKKKKSETIEASVLEIGDHYVKYRRSDAPHGPVYTMSIYRIRQIEFSDGRTDPLLMVNPRFRDPMNINLGFAAMVNAFWNTLTINAEYFIIPQLALVVETGTNFDRGLFQAGVKYHFNGNFSRNQVTPYFGLLAGSYDSMGGIQIPVGVTWMAPFGMNLSGGVNELFFFNTDFGGICLEMKVGWHF